MNTQYTEHQLRLAMAKLLPEKITTESSSGYNGVWWYVDYPRLDGSNFRDLNVIKETEWQYVVHLIEQTLNDEQLRDYFCAIGSSMPKNLSINEIVRANFNQRATALCRVLKITP